MKVWLATALACLLSIGAWAQEDPKAAVEPLKIARDTFYQDVSKFQAGQLTEEELVIRISEQFAPLINDRTVALRVMGKFARQATEAERDRFTDRLESSLVDAYARGLAAYGGEQLVLPEEGIILKPGRAVVEARLESPGREALPIQFALGFEECLVMSRKVIKPTRILSSDTTGSFSILCCCKICSASCNDVP